jgi:4-amino-4-deoxy-L-arabinose transferase-like glycosyltransferase
MMESSPTARSSKWWILLAVVATYAASMAAFYPRAISNIDESSYVAQAQAFADGEARRYWENPIAGLPNPYRPGDYPPGTALLMAPFVFAFGWQGAFLVPLLGLVGLILTTARWIEHERRQPLFALLVLLYPAALVMGRVAMSDVVTALVTTLSIVLFWVGADSEGRKAWWVSGFLAGASLAFRETSVLVVAPFYLGALLRRERGIHALVIAGTLGVLVRPWLSWLVFGDPAYVKSFGYGFSPGVLAANIQRYAFLTLVTVPGGLLAAVLYRGRRRPELITAVLLPLAFFSLYEYSGSESGWLKSMVLSGRFLLPVVPILVFALAHSVPEWIEQLSRRVPIARQRLESMAGALLVAGTVVASSSVHAAMDHFNAPHLEIRRAIYAFTTDDSWILTNATGTYKYLTTGLYEPRHPIALRNLSAEHYDRILDRSSELYLVLLERSDSEFWRRSSAEYHEWIADLVARADMELRFDENPDGNTRLRIWRITPKADANP